MIKVIHIFSLQVVPSHQCLTLGSPSAFLDFSWKVGSDLFPISCIRGNEKEDCDTKSALELPRVRVGVPYTDFEHCVSQYILSTWHDDWNGAAASKLHFVNPVLQAVQKG